MSLRNQMWQVIEWEDSSSDTIVYRYPHLGKEIMKGSSLTVRPSQVALFVANGQVADVFQPGKYKLDTDNLPILTEITNLFYREHKSRFQTEIYFVNTKQFVNQKWGTPSPLIINDPEFKFIRIGARGTYGFKVVDAKAFMQELFGTKSSFTVADVSEFLRSKLVSVVTDTIAENKVSALQIYANLGEFGEMCQDKEQEQLRTLGLEITNFIIESISLPKAVEDAIDERASLGILSDKMGTYTQKKAADAIGDAARNTGTVGTFMGIGVGQQMGNTMGNAMGGTMGTINQAVDDDKAPSKDERSKFCPECGCKVNADAKFCPQCGNKFDVANNVCPKCGATVSKGQKFCPQCGNQLK